MKTLRVIAFLCMCLGTAFSQTVVVSGHLITGGGAVSSANVSVLWELVNDSGQICKVSATGIIVPTSFSVTQAQLAAGISLIPNNLISCGSTLGVNRWRYTVKAGGIGTRQCSLNIVGTTNLDNTSCLNALPTTPIPATGDSLYARIDGTNAGFTGAITGTSFNFSGNGAVTNLNVTGTCTGCSVRTKRCYVDGVTYTTIQSAYNDSTNCLSVWLPPGYTETLSSDLVLSRSSVPIVFEGTATITMGTNRVTATGTVNGVSLIALGCGVTAGANLCVNFVYTGTGQAIVIGDSSTHSKDFYMHGISVQISGNGASCLQINNLDEFWVEHGKCAIQGGANSIGVITNGAGVFVGVGAFEDLHIIDGGGTNEIGYQFKNGTDHVQIIGGNLNLDAGASAVCVDVQGAVTTSIELMNPNFNTCNTAVKVESSATSVGAIFGSFRSDSGVTTQVSYAAGTLGNSLTCVDCLNNPAASDSGSNNSFIVPVDNQINSKLWLMTQTSGGSGFQISDRSDGSQAIAKGVGGATHMDSSAGNPVRFNQNSGSGFEFWDNSAVTFGGTSAGLLTTYKKIATVSNGIPAEYATVDLTAQTAAIGTTTIYAVPATGAGQYRVSWDSKITTAAGVSSTLGALTIIYTDPDGVVISSVVPAITSGGSIATTATTNNTSTFLIGVPLTINAKASTNIQYSFAYASNAASAMAYNLHIKLEAM